MRNVKAPLWVLFLLVTTCTVDARPVSGVFRCSTNDDCVGGYDCVPTDGGTGNYCAQPCDANDQCESGVCLGPQGNQSHCAATCDGPDACFPGEQCDGGACVNACARLSCNEQVCVVSPDGGASCLPCNENGMKCGGSDRACVQNGAVYVCLPSCADGLPCGPDQLCRQVATSTAPAKVCVSCPVECANTCSPRGGVHQAQDATYCNLSGEVCSSTGDEDGDSAADCQDVDCMGKPGCPSPF